MLTVAAFTGVKTVCATPDAQGVNLGDFDMMIAAHAVAANATFVRRDKAFEQVPARLTLEVW
jgi:tRNA(fMet)-specific endonuclease VapC